MIRRNQTLLDRHLHRVGAEEGGRLPNSEILLYIRSTAMLLTYIAAPHNVVWDCRWTLFRLVALSPLYQAAHLTNVTVKSIVTIGSHGS